MRCDQAVAANESKALEAAVAKAESLGPKFGFPPTDALLVKAQGMLAVLHAKSALSAVASSSDIEELHLAIQQAKEANLPASEYASLQVCPLSSPFNNHGC